jgi:hypothetical protein
MVGLPPISAEHQRERLAARDRLGCHLDALGEPGWFGVITEWLDHYAGLEQYVWPENDPIVMVHDVLQDYVSLERALSPDDLARELAALSFVGLAARHVDGGSRWDPLTEKFETWTRGKYVNVWDALESGTIRDMTQTRLVVRFTKASTPAT